MAISLLGIRDQVPAVPRGGRIGVSSWRADIFSDQFAACLRSCGLSEGDATELIRVTVRQANQSVRSYD
jgi:hypothetical protein